MSRRAPRSAIDTKWKCGWFPECNAPCEPPCRNREHKHQKCAAYGLHELDVCSHGKWGFYYSSNGDIQTWKHIHQLRYNPNGCTKVYLLIYNEDKQQILLDLNRDGKYNLPSYRRLTYEPTDLHKVASNFFHTLFSNGNENESLPPIPSRFIFTDSSAIYPVCLHDKLATQIPFKTGRKWFDKQEVERAMESVTLRWMLKSDKESFGYEVRDRGARLGRQPLFPLAALVLRWLIPKQGVESATSSRANSPVPSAVSSISTATSNATSGYASMAPSVCGSGINDEPDFHITFDEFIENEKPLESLKFHSDDKETIQESEIITNLMSNITFQDIVITENIIVLCYDVEYLDKRIFSAFDIEIFDNPFKFIARTLSLKDKTIYLIISTNKSHFVIPIIDKHYCVERIYLYEPVNTDSSSTSFYISKKVDGCYSDINEVYNQMIKDIKLTNKRSLRWNRSIDLFTMLHTQRLENQYSVIPIFNNIPHNEYILILDRENQQISHAYHGSTPCRQSTDAKECLQFIVDHTQLQIFFIISNNIFPEEIKSICDYQQIHAIYFFLQNSIRHRKVSGSFNQLEELFEQLHKDILFYREQDIHTSRIDLFTKIDQDQKLIPQLNDRHIDFLTYNLFIDILPFVPALELTLENLIEICEILFGDQGKTIARYISQLNIENVLSMTDPNFSQMILRLHQRKKINELFIFQNQFIHLHKLIFQSIKTPTFDSVYISKIITFDTLELIRSNTIEYINIGIFVLATKSLLTARTIARTMADNGLIAVLFQIDIVEEIFLLEIDSEHVLFRPGAVFCLKSIHHAPDNVFYVRMKPADKEYQLFKEQLQIEVDMTLSWLTYGNYMYFLHRFKEGETYFNYLLDKFSSEESYLSAIYNNMGLFYIKEYDEADNDKEQYFNKANMAYYKVLEHITLIETSSVVRKDINQADTDFSVIENVPIRDVIDYTTVIGTIADLYYDQNKYEEALQSYMKALKLSVDQKACRYYQKMICMIRKHQQRTVRIIHRIDSILKPNPEQTFIGIWLHDENLTSDHQNQMEIYLNQSFYYYQTFDSIEKLASYFGAERHVAKIFFILSISTLSSSSLVNLSQEYSNIEKIYIFSPLVTFKSICFATNDIDNLFLELKKDILDFIQRTSQLRTVENVKGNQSKPFYISRTNQISTSIKKFISKSDHNTPHPHTTDDSIQLFKFLTVTKILLSLSHNDHEIEDMWQACRQFYVNNNPELEKIADLSICYEPKHAIYCYTQSSSVFRIVNQACRTENMQQLYEFRVYINHLHQELEKLSKTQQDEGLLSSIRMVFRGQVLSESILQQLIDNEKKLISMNGFLSTTLSTHISNIYSAVENTIDEGKRHVQFVLTIDTINQSYANISKVSAIPGEEEILFSLGTIWRIDAIKLEGKLYQIELTSCTNLDAQLETIIANYTSHECNLSSIGDTLRDLGNYEEAEWFYQKMLKQDNLSMQTLGHLYYNIGIMERKLGRNDTAFEYFQVAAQLLEPLMIKSNQPSLSREIYKYDTDSTLFAVYNNLALRHEKNNAFDEAFNYYRQALEMSNGSISDLAIVNNNLGLLYSRYGSYEQAHEHLAKAVELMKMDLSHWAEFKRNLEHIESVLNI